MREARRVADAHRDTFGEHFSETLLRGVECVEPGMAQLQVTGLFRGARQELHARGEEVVEAAEASDDPGEFDRAWKQIEDARKDLSDIVRWSKRHAGC